MDYYSIFVGHLSDFDWGTIRMIAEFTGMFWGLCGVLLGVLLPVYYWFNPDEARVDWADESLLPSILMFSACAPAVCVMATLCLFSEVRSWWKLSNIPTTSTGPK